VGRPETLLLTVSLALRWLTLHASSLHSLPKLWPAVCLAVVIPAQDLAIEVVPVPGIVDSRVKAICEDASGRLWLGGTAGLWLHDGQQIHEISLPEAVGERQRVMDLAATMDGGLLVGLIDGLYRIAPGGREMRRVSGTSGWRVTDLDVGVDGVPWVRGDGGVLRSLSHGRFEEHGLPGRPAVRGMAVGANGRWIWDQDELWYGVGDVGPIHKVADMHVVYAVEHDGALIFCNAGGVGRVDRDGDFVWLAEGLRIMQVLPHQGGLWLRATDGLYWLARPGGPVRRVQLFRDRERIREISTQALAVDKQGLLWLGHELGAMRLCITDGVQNIMIRQLDHDERISAIHESPDGAVWIGTARGQLLRRASNSAEEWHAVPAPAGLRIISTITSDANGRLIVSAYGTGVWRLGREGWTRVGGDALSGSRKVLDHEGSLYGCTNKEVWRENPDGTVEFLPLRGVDEQVGALPRSFAKVSGELWLATYRGGLFRLAPARDGFVHEAMDQSVLGFVAVAGVPHLATIHDYWRVVDGGAERLSVGGVGPFRSLAVDAAGDLWIARTSSLTNFADGVSRRLTVSQGAHPMGYSYLASANCADGGLLFGGHGGYTRLRPKASLQSAERARIARSWLVDSDRPGARQAIGEAAPAVVNGRSFRVGMQLVDRTRDTAVPFEILARRHGSGELLAGADGAFEPVAGGDYTVSARFREATEAYRSVDLGVVRVQLPGISWGWWILGLSAFAAFATAAFVRRHRPQPSFREAAELAESLGPDSDGVLDIAFLVLAAIEADASTSSRAVWLCLRGGPRTLLSASGVAGAEAGRWLDEAEAQGRLVGPGMRAHEHGAGTDLAVEFAGDEWSFHVILRKDDGWSQQALVRLRRAMEPVRAAVSRHAWVTRLQSYCVRSGMSLEAGLHDLRGPLTALRLGIAQLQGDRAPDPKIEDLSQATESLIRAVDQMRSPDLVERKPHDVHAIVDGVVSALRPRADERDIELVCSGPEPGVAVAEVDEVWFARAVQNVVGNALKYTADGSRVGVLVDVVDDSVRMQIEDEGPGIRPEDWDYVFLPGGTAHNEPQNGEAQNGIGLWVSRQALRAMGGRLWITSGAAGGTCVQLSLPRSSQRVDSAAADVAHRAARKSRA
jgi:signal transduction histidine kinase